MKRGKLVCLEGCDSSGKSVQLNLISKYLKDNNYSYVSYHFPMYGHNQFSEMIAKFLRGEFGSIGEVDPLWIANMYALDRFRFLPELEKSLNDNDVVILDRYVFSNIAYQCAYFENEADILQMKNWIFDFEFGFLKLPYPDLNIFLDVPIKILEERLNKNREGADRNYLNGKKDIYEINYQFQSRVRNNYLNFMSLAPNCKIVNCAVPVQNISVSLDPEFIFNLYKENLEYILKL